MNTKLRFLAASALGLILCAMPLRADVLLMQNGDRYSGQVLSMSADTVVLKSEVLGKINVPRNLVATMSLGTNAAAPKVSAATSAVTLPKLPTGPNDDLSAAFKEMGGDTNFVSQIRQQMFSGSPEGAAKFDEMVSGLLSGQMNLGDVRKQAKDSADQLRELKRQLGPEADESLDAYLKVLDGFLQETDNEPANARPQSAP